MWTDSWSGGRQADTEEGRTTSPPVQPCPLPPPSDKTSLKPPPSPGHSQNPALDRSQSAPASLLPPPPQGATASGSSQSHPPFRGLPGPAPPLPATLETADPEAVSPAPPPAPGPSSQPLPPPASLDLSTSPNMEDAESLTPIAMEVGVVGGGEGTGSSALPSPPHPGPFPLQTGQGLEETQSTDAKNTQASVSAEQGEEEEERQVVEMDGICSEQPSTLPLHAELDLGLDEGDLASGPRHNSGSSSALAVDTAIDTQATPQVERDQTEGDRQPNCDTIPSLAAALKELHQLLMSNSRMLSQERSPTPSPSPSCREDADGVDDSPVAQSQPVTLEGAQSSTATAEMIAAKPLSADSDSSSGYEGSPERGEAKAMEGGREAQRPIVSRESEVDGKPLEETDRRSGSDPEVTSPPQEDLEFREPPEGQQGRGVVDGRAVGPDAPDPLTSPMEVAAPSALPTAANSPCRAPAMPDEDSHIPPRVSHPLPPTSLPCESSSSSPAPLPCAPSDRFPAAHIHQIQAAGFSATEAAEALEQVQGHVELALLMLLARKITVPS